LEEYPNVYGRAINAIRQLKEEYDKALQDVDVLVMPTLSFVARRHAPAGSSPDQMAMFEGKQTDSLSIKS
jgi:amidase